MLVETGSTNMIPREIKYFQTLEKSSGNIMTIVGRDGVIVGSGQSWTHSCIKILLVPC